MERKIWIGTVGPFLYDDTDLVEDEDGELSGESFGGITTTGQLKVSEAPTNSMHVIRQADVGSVASQPYVVGTLSFAATGFTPSDIAITANYVKIGRLINIIFPVFSGESNAATFTITGQIAANRPVVNVTFLCVGQNSGVLGIKGFFVNAAGSFVLQNVPGTNGGWTSSGTKGINGLSVTYLTQGV